MERKQKTETAHDGVHWLRTFGLFVLPLAAMLNLAGCSKEPVDGPSGASGKVALDFSVEGLGEMLPATKAALTANTTVRVIAYKSNASNPAEANYAADQAYYWNGSKLVPCIVNAMGDKTDDASDRVMKLLPGNYDFYAVSPAIELNSDKTTLLTGVDNFVDYAASAKMTATVPIQATYALTLSELQRQCAAVRFVITAAGNVNPTTLSVNSMRVRGLGASVDNVTVGGNIAAASSVSSRYVDIYGSSFTVSGTTATQTTPWSVLPLTNATLSLELQLTLDGVRKTVTGSVGVSLEKGKSHTITAKISTETDITISVEDWAENSGNNPNFEGTYPYVVNDWTLVVADAFGATSGMSYHSPWTTTPQHAESNCKENTSGLNTCSMKFQVAKNDAADPETSETGPMNGYLATGTYNSTFNKTRKSACFSYYEQPDKSDIGQWRLPTICEFRFFADTAVNINNRFRLDRSETSYYWTSTAAAYEDGPWGWLAGYYKSSKGYVLLKWTYYKLSTLGIVRCIRDC